MDVACYCRVSTDKDAQLDSLSKQIEYFEKFTKEKGHNLIKIYADEGIKGTQLKKRDQFNQMMKDAEQKMFKMIYVKDVSRFARNTVDFLQSIRRIKSLGIEIYFISNSLGIQEGSEMYLGMLAMMAQEESANLSKKVKFGKDVTAKKGRVPNFVFGYDKIDNYTLVPNPKEKEVVEKIFDLFVNEGYGTARIAGWLNNNGIKTKKNKVNSWYQVTVIQILRNEIYIGRVINNKSKVIDFLTGEREKNPKEDWIIVEKPEFRIIDNNIFNTAQKLLEKRRDSFNLMNKRESVKYPFSNLIYCSECNYSFRRLQRQYSKNGKVYKRWVDSIRNAKGANACVNKTIIDEEKLLMDIKSFIEYLIKNKKYIIKNISENIKKTIKKQNQDTTKNKQDIQKELDTLIKEKEKYMDMYKAEVITIEELKDYTKNINDKISKLKVSFHIVENKEIINVNIEKVISKYFNSLVTIDNLDNQFLKTIINKIIVYPGGNIKISLKIDPKSNINFDIPLENLEIPLGKTVPSTNDRSYCNYYMEWFLKVV